MRTVHRRALGFCLGCTFLCLGLAHADVDARHEEWRQEMIHKQARVARDFDELMTGIESLEVLILDNESGTDSDETRKAETTRRIDHWKVMKQFPVTSPTEVALLRSGLKRSIETAMAAAPCFEPRHALLFQKNGAEVQVIICFECASLRINGSIRLNEALISQAALNEFYHVFRAHGLTKRDRLGGLTDSELAAKLTGRWWNESIVTSRDDRKLRLRTMRALGVDGTYLEKTEATKWQDASGRSGIEIPEKSESGKWRVKEGLLLMTPAIPDVMMSSVPLEKMIPIMELSDRHYTCVGIDLHATEEVTWNRASDE